MLLPAPAARVSTSPAPSTGSASTCLCTAFSAAGPVRSSETRAPRSASPTATPPSPGTPASASYSSSRLPAHPPSSTSRGRSSPHLRPRHCSTPCRRIVGPAISPSSAAAWPADCRSASMLRWSGAARRPALASLWTPAARHWRPQSTRSPGWSNPIWRSSPTLPAGSCAPIGPKRCWPRCAHWSMPASSPSW